jgi:hypothetical protein
MKNYWLERKEKREEKKNLSNRKQRYQKYEKILSSPEAKSEVFNLVDTACKENRNGDLFVIKSNSAAVEKEIKFSLDSWKIKSKIREWAKTLATKGDLFIEVIADPFEDKAGIYMVESLPPETVYRIETIKGELLEFQQSLEGPDYSHLGKSCVEI